MRVSMNLTKNNLMEMMMIWKVVPVLLVLFIGLHSSNLLRRQVVGGQKAKAFQISITHTYILELPKLPDPHKPVQTWEPPVSGVPSSSAKIMLLRHKLILNWNLLIILYILRLDLAIVLLLILVLSAELVTTNEICSLYCIKSSCCFFEWALFVIKV